MGPVKLVPVIAHHTPNIM